MADSSFDIVSKVDHQEADNALNQAKKEVEQRYDFKGTGASIEWSGELGVLIKANADERALAVLDVFKEKLIKRGISLKALEADDPKQSGKEVPVTIGTMIELPRAALLADEIAEYADFFSFGTNDLTQTTIGISRDDAENGFLTSYVVDHVMERNPFESIDVDGVGQLVQMGVERGRSAKPKLKTGVCGEHGGDPDSIEFFHSVGLNYVSCSPFRVPIARFAAARAVLNERTA